MGNPEFKNGEAAGSHMHMAMMKKQNAPMDVVCGMPVNISVPDIQKSEYNGKTYYFCNPSCKKQFDREPEKYVKQEAEGGRQKAEGTSPDHPGRSAE